MQVARDEAVDAAVERGREQHRLVLALDAVEDLLHLGHEAHVGHAVGLVEHEHLDVRDRELAALHQVDEPAGVPMTTSTPLLSASICGSMPTPP